MQPLSRTELRSLRALTHQSVRERRGAFIIEGVRALDSTMQFPEKVHLLAVTPEASDGASIGALLERAVAAGIKVRSLSQEQLDEIAGTQTPSGLIGWIDWAPVRRPQTERLIDDLERCRASRLLCLDSVSDPGNVGSLLRAVDAFDLDGVLMGKGTVEITNPKVVRAAAGSVLDLPYVAEGISLEPILQALEARGWAIFRAVAHGGSPPPGEPPHEPWLLLLGSEARGVGPDLSSIGSAVHISTSGSVESLNVAVAGGILLYALSKKRSKNG